ncbi:hypothetical protein LTR99_004441 [Exophiala xenobiotica]|uniref:Rhodopsin domain-containing protein n=1 Tax=Vermiconidia calcicola TaxID=1690605 RepID=A0AAV9QBZ7_9PEZI|nr:hypothetical protein LTR92_000186 [Exophiala xenobiotica]KAK5303985.1 hypothetical protein LTR99_004441 [Exophiala xenobiotica]KAK5338595.1 hypothetical protein LTR98_004995 [Exophiala xenobiotica]KAK5432677.1 hypothetical protein LTR34_004150 [Exophiala xenobiotica]KAK5539721.1 hypothetical protein LTR25_003426 [Vermiconidia calcicola]
MIAPILAFVLVVNRVYWRFKMVGRLGPDDYSTILALTFFVTQCGATIAAVNYGYGRPLETMNLEQASQALEIFYKLTINCTKLSILFLYRHIFTDHLWPINGAWDRWDDGVRCVNIYALWYSNAIYNIVTDFILVLMVPPVIFSLKLPTRQKLALTCIFGLGVIVCAASISRLTTLYSSANGTDATAGSFVSTIWTSIEAGLGVICANLPMLRTPLQHFFPRLFPSRSGTNRVSSTPSSSRSESGNGRTLVLSAKVNEPMSSPGIHSTASDGFMDAPPSTGNGEALNRATQGLCTFSRSPVHNDCEAQQDSDQGFGWTFSQNHVREEWCHGPQQVR